MHCTRWTVRPALPKSGLFAVKRLRQIAEDEGIRDHVMFGHDGEQFDAFKTRTHAYT
jgi:hypothetical protein